MIHQCLYGYSDGHDLLATSLPLAREQRTLLSQLTDLSGPEPVQGFDGYLSGFPIAGGLYALTRTWYAAELPRPGCVWTHCLLLDSESLSLPDVRSLAALHARPYVGNATQLESYTTSLSITPSPTTSSPVDTAILSAVLNALYRPGPRRVCLPIDTNATVEPLFVAVFNQQWPALRGSFSFTTGMLGSGAWPFDLQALPIKNRRLFQSSDAFALIESASLSDVEKEFEPTAVVDAIADKPTTLRSFLWMYGDDFHDARVAFRSLADLYGTATRSKRHERATIAYEHLVSHFDASPDSAHLRHTLFEFNLSFDPLEVLEVAVRDVNNTLGLSNAEISAIASSLTFDALRELTIRMFGSDGIDRDKFRAVVSSFAERFDSYALDSVPAPVIAAVMGHRPDLARNPESWNRQEEANIAVLDQIKLLGTFNTGIAYGLLRTGTPRLLYQAREMSSEVWIEASAQIFSESLLAPIVEEFVLGLFWDSRASVRARLQSGAFGAFIKLAGAVLDVSTREADAFPLANFDCAAPLPELQDGGAELHACACLLMIALVRSEPAAVQLAAQSFSSIYWSARHQKLPWDLWKSIEVQLPRHLLEWDRCARLIEGMVSRFVQRSWSAADFVKTFRADEEFERAINTLVALKAGDYIDLVSAVVSSSGTSFQREQISRRRS